MNNKQSIRKTSWLVFLQGLILGIVGLSAFYYLFLFAVTRDPAHPLRQFKLLQPWMSMLIIGFGIQFGLFWLLRKGFYFSIQEKHDAQVAAGTGSAVSGITMAACCVHHVVDFLPILGLPAIALFLSEYQKQLLILGVIVNLAGIGMMLWFITGKTKPRIIVNYLTTRIKRVL